MTKYFIITKLSKVNVILIKYYWKRLIKTTHINTLRNCIKFCYKLRLFSKIKHIITSTFNITQLCYSCSAYFFTN